MRGSDLLERDSPITGGARPATTVKTVLVHVQNDESLDARVQTGLAIARACSAHLSCIHVTPFEAYVAFDNFGGLFVMNDVIKALDEEEERLRTHVERELGNEDVSWDYAQVTGSIGRVVAGHGALADLVVSGRNGHARHPGPAVGMLGDLLHWSRTPLLIPADDERPLDPTGTAVIAWDGSFQAANAVRSSIGLLKLASEVRVLQIAEEKEKENGFPGTRLLEYLSRQGVHAELRVEQARRGTDHQTTTAMLLTHAQAVNASYMVLGAYSHSRIGEYVVGGVTRSLLSASPVPILLAR